MEDFIPQTINDNPDIKYLNKYVKPYVGGACDKNPEIWKVLGIELLGQESETTLNTISADNRGSVVACCSGMFSLWLERQPEASWKQLIDALIDVELVSLAMKIKRLLIPSEQQESSQPDLQGKTLSVPQKQPLLTNDVLRAEFGRLILEICYILGESPDWQSKLVACKKFCAFLKASDNANALLFSDERLAEIDGCKDFDQFFKIVNQHLSWDEYFILTEIIDKCGSDKAEEEFQKYKRKMAICNALEIISSVESNPPQGFERFCVVIDKPYRKLTAKKYKEIKEFIFTNLDTHRYVTNKHIRVLFDSLHLEWHITAQATPHMIEMARDRRAMFTKNLYVFMEIGREIIISRFTEQIPTPLHLAAINGCEECVDLLLKHRANIEDMHWKSPNYYLRNTKYYEKKEMKKNKKDILEAMYKARKDGCTIKVRYGKILLCGANGAGKTNFLNLLLNEKFNSKHISTEVAKPHQATIVVKPQMIKHHDEVAFKIMNTDDEIDHLMLCLPEKCTKPSTKETTDTDHSCEHSSIATQAEDRSRHTIVEDIIGSKLSDNATKQPPDEIWDIFTFIDTGGLPQFISMLPVVNISAMITFIVYKMTKDGKAGLDQKFEVIHGNKKGKNSFKKYFYDFTYLQLIKTLISHASVNLLPDERFDDIKDLDNKKPYKSISFIGTHSQHISESKISEIDEVLFKTMRYNKNACLKNIKRELNENYTYIIPVDNKKQSKSSSAHHKNPKKFTNISKIRGCIYECIKEQDVYTVPIQWLLLDLEIRKKCKNEEINFITYNDVLTLAKEKNLGEGNFIKSALRFHHLHGVLLYFEDVEGMRELVITNHQWLFEKLTKIVLCKFEKDKTEEFEDLKKGIFRESMLNKPNIDIVKDFKKSEIDITVINPTRSFIKLLQHLLIIAPLQKGCTKYFMPSLLESCDITTLQQIIPGENHFKTLPDGSEPLLIQFEFIDKIDGFPRGFFCFLIVQLIHSENWKLYEDNAEQNLITFLINDHSVYRVTLVDKIFFLEVHVTHESSDMAPIHHEVFKTIEKSLIVVGERLHIAIKIKVGFLCKKCQDTSEEHMTYLSENTSEHTYYCSCIAQKQTELKRSHEVWFSTEATSTPTKPKSENQASGMTEEIYYQCYPKLVLSLPMKDPIFLAHLIKLLPYDLKEKVEAKSTSPEAASCFLDRMIGPAIDSGNNEPLNLLLTIMEASDDINLKELSKSIRKDFQKALRNEPIADIFEIYPCRLSPEPTPTQLIELLDGVEKSWKIVAEHLLSDEDGSKVQYIEGNNHGDIQKCRAEMIHEYCKSDNVSWKVVLQALMKAGENNIAEKIIQKL